MESTQEHNIKRMLIAVEMDDGTLRSFYCENPRLEMEIHRETETVRGYGDPTVRVVETHVSVNINNFVPYMMHTAEAGTWGRLNPNLPQLDT